MSAAEFDRPPPTFRNWTHLGDPDDVEADRLGERAALADSDVVSDLDAERGRAVGGEVAVALLVPRVLRDEVLEQSRASVRVSAQVAWLAKPRFGRTR